MECNKEDLLKHHHCVWPTLLKCGLAGFLQPVPCHLVVTAGIAQVNLVLVQMLFLDLTLGTLAQYSLKLHFPSKFVVSLCMVNSSVSLLRKGPVAQCTLWHTLL